MRQEKAAHCGLSIEQQRECFASKAAAFARVEDRSRDATIAGVTQRGGKADANEGGGSDPE
ncbi:MAG: hypothetical protein ABI442_12375 [Gemmatimonadaceae bacterium]